MVFAHNLAAISRLNHLQIALIHYRVNMTWSVGKLHHFEGYLLSTHAD